MLVMFTMRRFPAMLRADHHVVLIFAILAMIAGLLGLRSGLSPFAELRARLMAVRGGRSRLLDGAYPTEVQPLVNDLNSLLEHRERIVKRALATAGDLAHGLKTPLALSTQEAERAAAAGHTETADAISQQVERMRRQVEYHLAHARAAASGADAGARCAVAESAEGLCRTLRRLYAERNLTIEVNVPAEDVVQVQREDLDELLGNLLDNACKWARTRVEVTSHRMDKAIAITVDDDGAGLDPAMREAVLRRGVRADEAAPGSGFGLAIVRELADLYGGSVELTQSPAAGLRASLKLPAV